MTDSIDPTAEQMAADLIDHVKRTHTPRLALLEDRITATLVFLDQITTPNPITLDHVRAFLTGAADYMLPFYLAADRSSESREATP